MTAHISSSGGLGWVPKLRGRSRITSSKRFSSIILLLECSQLLSELRSCRGEPALRCPFGDTENASYLRVCVSLNVVHYQRYPVCFRESVDRPRDAFLQIRLRFRSGGLDQVSFVERDLTSQPYLRSSRVRDDRHHYSVQPGRERRISAKLRETRERANKCVLRELPRLVLIPAQSVSERVDAWRVRVVQRTPGQPIPGQNPGDEL